MAIKKEKTYLKTLNNRTLKHTNTIKKEIKDIKTSRSTVVEHTLQEISCNYKSPRRMSDLPKIAGSRDIFENLQVLWSEKIEYVEEFMIVCMNRANRMTGWAKISQGGISGTVADPKVIFQVALMANASSIIIAHNHPSGNYQPSEADIRLTRKIKDAGLLLDLPLLDHVIMTTESYYSFADEGQI